MQLSKKFATTSRLMALLCLALPSFAVPCQAGSQDQKASPSVTVSGDLRSTAVYNETAADTIWGNRLRLQTEVSVADNVTFMARAAAWKNFNTGAVDSDSFMFDRFFLDWREIGNSHFGFAMGRLPTSGAPAPAHLRLGKDRPESRLSAFTDIVIDGGSASYDTVQAGRDLQITLYAGSQSKIGYESRENPRGLEDTFIYGGRAAAAKDRHRFTLQFFAFDNIYNLPEDVAFFNPIERGIWQIDSNFYDPLASAFNPVLVLHRKSLGDLYQTAASWLGTWDHLDAFVSLGWSHTKPQDIDELGTGLLSSFNINNADLQDEDGFSVYTGLRYDLRGIHSKVGVEYNYGSKYWIGLEDADTGKLATRGSVLETYWLFMPELPQQVRGIIHSFTGRIGYIYTWYDYTGSGFWLGEPVDVDQLRADPLNAQFYTPIDHQYQLYGAIDIAF